MIVLASRVGHGIMVLMESGAREVKGGLSRLVRWPDLRALAGAVLDQVYPPVCAVCEAPVTESPALCPKCFSALVHITAPLCPVLGVPFETDPGPGALSAEALAEAPPFSRARAAVRYGEVAQTLVSRLKYGDRTELADLCARLMARAGWEYWDARPMLVAVPLHPSRLRFRRYNQSVLLAQALQRQLGYDIDLHLVKRHRRTRSQVGLSGDGRTRNVQGAFSAHPDLAIRLRGRRVVLIDDVYTTGATVSAVSRALLRAGAEGVDVLTFARVVRGEEVPI
jgi:ComF family protein